MRGVPDEDGAADAERPGHPLVHAVQLPVDDRVAGRAGRDALELPFQRGPREGLRLALPGGHRPDSPPGLGGAQQEKPLAGVGHVVDLRDAGQHLGEVDARAGDEEALGVGVAGEVDAERPPHGAARAVGADHPGAAQLAGAARGADDDGRAVPGVRHDAGDAGAEQQLDTGRPRQPLVQHPHQVLLVELEPVGERGLVREEREVELRDQALPPVAEVVHGHDQALGVHPFRDAEFVEEFERRRVERGGAPVGLRLVLGLDQHHGDAEAVEGGGGDHSDRTAADDDHRAAGESAINSWHAANLSYVPHA